MGKAKKIKVSKGETKEPKIGLAEQIEREKAVKFKNRQKVRRRADDEEEVGFRIYFLSILFFYFNCNLFNLLSSTYHRL